MTTSTIVYNGEAGIFTRRMTAFHNAYVLDGFIEPTNSDFCVKAETRTAAISQITAMFREFINPVSIDPKDPIAVEGSVYYISDVLAAWFMVDEHPLEDTAGVLYYSVKTIVLACMPALIQPLDDFYKSAFEPNRQAAEATDRDGEKVYGVAVAIHNGGKELEFATEYLTTDLLKDVRYDFYPDIDVPMLMDQYMASKSNILIFKGKPGTGKTSLLRRAMADFAVRKGRDIAAVYVQSTELLKQDKFYNAMTKTQPDFILLDDLDHGLHTRLEGTDNAVVEKLLRFSNGLFRCRTKIIVTTNRDFDRTDTALIRKGRTFDIIDIPHLHWAEARMIWENLYGLPRAGFMSEFRTVVDTDGSITQADLATAADCYTEFKEASYLRNPGLSVHADVLATSADYETTLKQMSQIELDKIRAEVDAAMAKKQSKSESQQD
jgi:SpoVK/Ycf46/Vps4 family AAA+-type ATPase